MAAKSIAGSTYERGPGFIRRNWIVIIAAVMVVIITAVALSWWLVLPTIARRTVADMVGSIQHITGAEITHGEVILHGIDRLEILDLAVSVDDAPLVALQKVEVDFDAFAFSNGLPTVVLISMEGFNLEVVRRADGTDNLSPIVNNLIAYLDRDREGGGDASLLARILRQTPALAIDDMSLTVRTGADGQDDIPFLFMTKGTVRAENPNLSMRTRQYLMDMRFQESNGKTRTDIKVDLDIDKRSFQADLNCTPAMYLKWQDHEIQLEQVRVRSGEFVEVNFGRISLANLLQTGTGIDSLVSLGGFGGDASSLRDLTTIFSPEEWLRTQLNKVSPYLVRMGYQTGPWEQFSKSMESLVRKVLERVFAEADGERLVLDHTRILFLQTATMSGDPLMKLKVAIRKGSHGVVDVQLSQRRQQDLVEATFDVTSPSRIFQFSGDLKRETGKWSGTVNVTTSINDPYLQVRGSVHLDGAVWDGDLRAQLRTEDPPLALSAELVTRDGRITGEVEGELAVPGLFVGDRVRLSVRKEKTSGELSGQFIAPTGQKVAVQTAFDSINGIKRFSASTEEDLRHSLGEYDVLLHRVRLGRDGIVHLEDLAVVRSGATRERAVVQMTDLSLYLTRQGLELIDTIRKLDFSQPPRSLLGSLISSVEVVAPVIVLRQPPRLPSSDDQDIPVVDDMADKISDALEEESKEAVVMYEPFRLALESLVLRTGEKVTRLIKSLLQLGDEFPLQKVSIKEGKFEYSGGLSEQDRLITELSNFNASVQKVTHAGNLGGKFSISADFTTAVANQQADSSLNAEVDLATGDLTGTVKIGKMALFPYRFFIPDIVSLSNRSFLEETVLGFDYKNEADRFRVWGQGRISDFSISSKRISAKPMDHLSIDFLVGNDQSTGVIFELGHKKMFTSAPILVSFARIVNAAVEFSSDASKPSFPTFSLGVRLPEMSVNDLIGSIPKAMGRQLEGMQVDGRLQLTLSMAGDSRDLRGMEFRVSADEENARLSHPGRYVDFNKLTGAFRHRPPTHRERTIIVGEGRKFVPLDRISPWLVLAVTTTEDGSFFRHDGFNTYQVKMSVIRNLEKGRFVRGASTITMQLVKNLFLSHDKTMSRKLQEILLTWLIEKEIRKDKLIEIYLNIIEWGDGVYGIKEACDYYFQGLPPDQLTPSQAAFLASFIPYPRPFQKRFKKGMFGADRTKRWNRWWGRRQKLVHRIVRAMVNNCQKLGSKCPSQEQYCRIMELTCKDPGRELVEADNVKNLDDLFVTPEPIPLGDTLSPMEF